MADFHTNININAGLASAITNSSVQFKSPITLLQLAIWLSLASLAFAGLFYFPQKPIPLPIVIEQSSKPVSLMKTGSIEPDQPSLGITILPQTRFKANHPKTNSTDAPVAAGADIATGFAISLGEAHAFSTLTSRFERIAKLNGALFQNLEPRAIFIETASGLSARLLAGPFENEKEATIICGILQLPNGIVCKTQPFDGDLISRQ